MTLTAIMKKFGDILENLNANFIMAFLVIAFIYIAMVVYNSFLKKSSPTLMPNKRQTTQQSADDKNVADDLAYEKLVRDPEVFVKPGAISLGEDAMYLPSNGTDLYNYKELSISDNDSSAIIKDEVYTNDAPLFNTTGGSGGALIAPKLNATQRRVNFYDM
jgi:hypothetical protein